MKKHDKFLSVFSFILEKKCVKNIYFLALLPSLLVGKIVTCGFWGCHLWHLTGSLVAFEALKSHKWEAQSIALTTQKHSFDNLKRCKENGSGWYSTTSKNAHFSHICPRKEFFFNRGPSREGEIQNLFYILSLSLCCFYWGSSCLIDFIAKHRCRLGSWHSNNQQSESAATMMPLFFAFWRFVTKW